MSGRESGTIVAREALSIRDAAYAPRDPRTAEAQVALGRCLALRGQRNAARPLLEAGLPVLRARPGRRDPLVAQGQAALADVPSKRVTDRAPRLDARRTGSSPVGRSRRR